MIMMMMMIIRRSVQCHSATASAFQGLVHTASHRIHIVSRLQYAFAAWSGFLTAEVKGCINAVAEF